MSKIIKNKNIIEKGKGKEAKDTWENAGTAEFTFNFLQTTEGVSNRIYPWLLSLNYYLKYMVLRPREKIYSPHC